MPDIFDQISPPKGDVFDQVASGGPVQNLNATSSIGPMPMSQRLMAYAPIRAIHDAIVGPAVQPAVGQIQGLLPIAAKIAYGDEQKPGVMNISPATFVPPAQNEVEGAAKGMLGQVNLQNASIMRLLGPLIGATGAGANLLKAGTAAYLTAQGAQGAAQQAGERFSGVPQTPEQKGESDVNMVLSALQAAGSPFLAMPEKATRFNVNKLNPEAWAAGPKYQLPLARSRFEVGPQGDIFDKLQPNTTEGGQSAVRELRTDSVSKTQAPGDIQKVEQEVRQGASEEGDARKGQGQQGQGQGQGQGRRLIRKEQPEQRYGENVIPANVSYTDPRTGFTVEGFKPESTEADAIPRLQQKMRHDLVPAIATENGIIKATSDEMLSHDDVLKANKIEPAAIKHEDPRRGFVDSMGNWYTRKQAEEVTGLKGTAEAGGLDSMDLPRASYEKGVHAEDWKNAKAAAAKVGTKLYGGLFFMDPDFWRDQIRIAGNVKTDGQMLYNRMRNALGKDSATWKAVDTEAFRKFVVGAGRVSPDEVREYLEKTRPKVEVRKFGEENKNSPAAIAYATAEHALDTAGYKLDSAGRLTRRGTDFYIDRDNPNVPKRVWEWVDTMNAQKRFMEERKASQTHWSSIAPKPESSMPGYTEIAVVKPHGKQRYWQWLEENGKSDTVPNRVKFNDEVLGGTATDKDFDPVNKVQFPSSHSFPPNTLGFVRGYMETTPDGKKVFHVIEVQSDWAQKMRDLRENRSENGPNQNVQYEKQNDPLLQHYERLALKAAIDHARSQGADSIAISDAETAMMTEGHDRVANYEPVKVFDDLSTFEKRQEVAKWKEEKPGIRRVDTIMGSDGLPERATGLEKQVPQQEGMRLHYDRTLPKIAEELTGEKGKRVEFGEHKMARLNATGDDGAGGIYRIEGQPKFRSDLIFKTPEGQPKTSVSARLYPIAKARENFSLFGSDKPKPLSVADVIPEIKPGGSFSGVPIFDPELLGISPERAAALKEKYLKMLAAKGKSAASDVAQSAKQFAPKSARAAAILGSTTARPMERTQELIAQPGEKLGVGERAGNLARRLAQVAGEADKVVNPWDVLYDWMDGGKAKYNGPLMENIRKPLDSDFNDELNLRSQLLDPIRTLIKKNKMGKVQSQRIGVYLNTLQEGGRDRMIASGIQPEIIAKIERTITPAERAVAQSIRQTYDQTFPLIQKVAKDVDGIELNPIDNYFSWEREWRKYKPDADELASPKVPSKGATVDDVLWPGLESVRTRVKPGSIEKRVPNAATPIKIDAFEIVDRYVRDAAHYIAMRKHLKEISEIVRSDEFTDKYGKMGQDLIMEHLNTIARQGRYKRNGFLDALRKTTSRGVIAFRLPSQFVHLANIPLGMQRAGVARWYKGLDEALSDEGQAFLKKNFAETFERGGGEPALREVAEGNLGKLSAYNKVSQAGFWLQRRIDQLNAQATVIGVYMRELEKKGLKPEDYAELPLDRAAIEQARVEARRAVASPLYKDVPPLLNRGGSLTKSLMQFQNTFLDQWSNIRYDLAQVGVLEALKGNPKLAAQMTAALFAMLMVETGVKYGYKQALNKSTGNKQRQDDTFSSTLEHEALRRIPGMGQIQSQIVYGETGVPSIDALEEPIKQGVKYAKSSQTAEKTLAAMRATGAAMEVVGIPGASQATDIATAVERKKLFKSHTERLKEQEGGKDVEQMTLKQRLQAEQKYKKAAKPMSKEEQASAAERSIANIAKRGEEVSKELDKGTQQWVESRGLTIPGYDNKLKIGKDDIYLDDSELQRLHGYIKDEYMSAISELRTKQSRFDKMPTDEQKIYFNETLIAARTRARFKLIQELSRSVNERDSQASKSKKFSIFNND